MIAGVSYAEEEIVSKADMLAQALDDFLNVSPEVEAAAVVSADGLPMASALPPHVEEERLAAMSAALLTLGDRAAAGLGKGGLAQVFIEGESGHVILMSAGKDAVLVAVTSRGAKIGLVLFEMRKTASRTEEVMASTPSHEVHQVHQSQPQPPVYEDHGMIRPPEPVPAAEVVQPSVSAWE